ncbi:MAG TPA: recombination protein RecR [Lentisphaeria bacterium]|nr:MAG: recombination protein RecR [Lentisphaerae bacterium GWF2_49_21]HBC89052.1 recombination protein RecR [Lentisphaeria bacterium]
MKHEYPEGFQNLINLLKGLPGVGRRTAERMAFSMLKWPPEKLAEFGTAVCELRKNTTFCPECGNLSSAGSSCGICSSASRDRTIICAVEESFQIFNIEQSGLFKGVYHVIGGKLSPLEGKGIDDLNIKNLLKRIDVDKVKEVILAFSNDVEGQATSIYIAEELKKKNVNVTRLAHGLPAGSDISYADSATIAAALHGRRPL